MELKVRINELLEKYDTEIKEFYYPTFSVNKKRKRLSKSMLSSQISVILIDAIEEIRKSSGLTKCDIIEHIIFLGLTNMEFEIME